MDIELIRKNLTPCSNHGCIIAPNRKGVFTNAMCQCNREPTKMQKLAFILRADIAKLEADKAMLIEALAIARDALESMIDHEYSEPKTFRAIATEALNKIGDK